MQLCRTPTGFSQDLKISSIQCYASVFVRTFLLSVFSHYCYLTLKSSMGNLTLVYTCTFFKLTEKADGVEKRVPLPPLKNRAVTAINYFLPELAKSHWSVVPLLARQICIAPFCDSIFFPLPFLLLFITQKTGYNNFKPPLHSVILQNERR